MLSVHASSVARFCSLPLNLFYLLRAARRGETASLRPAEQILRHLLQRKNIGGYRFEPKRRLHDFVVDYYCEEARLAVEIEHAAEASHPRRRTEEELRHAHFSTLGITLLRFPEEVIVQRPEGVRNTILECCITPVVYNPLPSLSTIPAPDDAPVLRIRHMP